MGREGDVVLVYYEDKPAVYARIESIEPDIKKDWYHVTLQLLTLPAQIVTWILRSSYIAGEPFTMGGKVMHLEMVKRVSRENGREVHGPEKNASGRGKVIPFKKT
jgi:hypothetical protein